MSHMLWHNIPLELRRYQNWVVCGDNKVPINPRTGRAASVSDPSTWASYEEAIRAGWSYIGFVLSDNDPFTIIDLDNKPTNPITPEKWKLHEQILSTLQSYTERSAGGLGYHIILKGKIPSGVNSSQNNFEMYSSQRFMICTGNVIPGRGLPIKDGYQDILDKLYSFTQPAERAELIDADEVMTDEALYEMAIHADNGAKFKMLYEGRWQEVVNEKGEPLYGSQSEADHGFLEMIAFYVLSNTQVRRFFRKSALGQREKAKRDDYLNFSLEKIRAKYAPVNFEELHKRLNEKPSPGNGISKGVTEGLPPTEKPVGGVTSTLHMVDNEVVVPSLSGFPLPEGLAGELATYFYATAIKPVPEMALTAALALISGVAGRSYNISGTGLNQYMLLLGKTGSGKEGMARGIDNLFAAIRPTIPMIDDFMGPGAFASGQALVRVMNETPCFISVLGEFGLTLQSLCDPSASSPTIMLRKVLLDLYSKSGWNDSLKSSAYSDKEKSTKIVQAPNVTILAESTPETFFDGLEVSHISEGLIPRFSVVEYKGARVATNENANCRPEPGLVERFSKLAVVGLSTRQNNTCGTISIGAEADRLFKAYDRECDDRINRTDNIAESQLWNRAHLKVLKLSGVIAVGINPHTPSIDVATARWAIDFVRYEVTNMSTHFTSGDIGQGDSKINFEVRRIVREYMKDSSEGYYTAKIKMYDVDLELWNARVIPYGYLQKRTASMSSFRRDKRGATGALKTAIQDLLDSDFIQEVPVVQMVQKFKTKSKAYVVGKFWTTK